MCAILVEVTSPAMQTPEASPAALPVSTAHPAALPLVTLNDLLWLLYLYPIRFLAKILPRSVLYAIGNLSNPIVQFGARRAKARSAPWIAASCQTTPEDARRIAGQSLSNGIFRTLDGLLLLRPSGINLLRCAALDGIQHLEQAVARGKGVILLAGHFWANQIALRYLKTKGYSTLSVHKQRPPHKSEGRFGREFLHPRTVELQERVNPDHIYLQDPDCSLKVLRRLRAGGLVALQIDGRGETGIDAVFLGVPWSMRAGILEIVRLSDCAVVPMLCVGRSTGFRIRFEPMLEMEGASSREAFTSANVTRFLSVVEGHVKENPDQWRLWNRW